MKIGDIVYHPIKGKLEVIRTEHRALGNRIVVFAIDDRGMTHELDGTEMTEAQYIASKQKKGIADVFSKVTKLKGDKGDKGDTGEEGYTPVKGVDYIDGYNPIKGKDYFIKSEIEEFIKKTTPLKGKHYFDGLDGKDGKDGRDGKTPIKGLDYKDGDIGKTPKHKWKGTKLGFEKPSGKFGRFIELRGTPGKDADPRDFLEGGGHSFTGLVKVDNSDTPDTLENKILAGTNITITKSSGANPTLTLSSAAGGGTFISLTDTPASYAGQGGQAVRVNAGATALEFYTPVTTDRLVGVDAAATPGYLGATGGSGVLRTGSPISYTDGGNYVTLDIAATGIKDTHIDWGTGMGQVSTFFIPEQTNLYYTDERVDDRVAVLIQNGTGIAWTYDDVANTLTGNVSITQYTDEMAQDAVGGMIVDTNTIDLTYTDATPELKADVRYQDSTTIDLSDDASGLKADVKTDSINDTHIDWGTGANQVSIADIPDGFTTGSVPFSDGTNLIEDNSNLFWDDTNNRLSVGINSGLDPRVGMTVSGDVDILHTATEADDHVLELDVNAAGYGDVKAIDINYTTGVLTAGEDEGILLINIDKTLATGGDIFALEILATDQVSGTTGVYGMKTGPGIGPIHQDSGVFANPTTGTDNTASTDVPAMIDGSTGTTTAIFENNSEYIIIGAAAAFEEIEFILTTPSSNPGIEPTFWYSTAGSGQFTQFTPVNGTNGFRNTGVVAWDASDLTGHTTNDDTGTYDIKIIRTRNSLGTSPILGYAKTAATTEYIWDKNGDVNINTLTSSVTTGTAPLTIASTTVVPNLNVDQVDGYDLDQSVVSGASPTFDGTNFSGIPNSALTVGIADNNLLEVDDADAADNDYAKFTANGIEGRSYSEVMGDLSGTAAATFSFNSQDITNIGTMGVTGTRITKGWFTDLTCTNAIAGSVTGNAATATLAATVTVDATTTDTTCFPLLGESASGSLEPQTDATLTYNADTGALAATSFVGALTGQADTVATITGLAPDTATTQATQAGITTCANLTTIGTVTTGGLSTGAVLGDVTMTLGSDADGDVYYRASNKLTRLAKGAATEVLTMNAGATAPEWTAATGGTKATGAEIDTGTDDVKYATAKALKDSHNVPSIAPGTAGNSPISDGTDWTSAANVSNTTAKARASLGTNQANIGSGAWVTIQLDTEQHDTGSNFNTGTYTFTVPTTGCYHIEGSAYLYDVIADGEALALRFYKNGSTAISANQLIAAKANTGHTIKTSDIVCLTATDTLVLQVKVGVSANADIYNNLTFTYMAVHLLSI